MASAAIIALLLAAVLYVLPFVPVLFAPLLARREEAHAARPPRNAIERLVRWLPALVFLVAVGLGATLMLRMTQDKRICVFHFADNRSIELLYNDFMHEIEIPIVYKAYRGSQLVQGPTACSGTPIPFRAQAADFRAYEFASGKVTVEQKDQPDGSWRLIVEYYFSGSRPAVRGELKSFESDNAQGTLVLPEDLLR